VNTLLKDVTYWCVLPSSGDKPATPNHKSDVNAPHVLAFKMAFLSIIRAKLLLLPVSEWSYTRIQPRQRGSAGLAEGSSVQGGAPAASLLVDPNPSRVVAPLPDGTAD
jgi:hypothetical protein